jgi:hypothetical protein
VWFFAGNDVVICMVNVVKKVALFEDRKMRHESELYFQAA